jgi:CBS domain-containing protein
MMSDTNVGTLVVMEDGKLAGFISDRDYARKIALMGRTSPGTQVRDIMTTRVQCVGPGQTVQEAMALMTAKAVRHLPVLEHEAVIGIASIGDLVKSVIGEQRRLIDHTRPYRQFQSIAACDA